MSKDRYGSLSPLKKFAHKNTGYIVFGVILVIAVPLLYIEWNSYEFFEKWSCHTVWSYVLLDGGGKYPKHSELTEDQHVRLHEILAECPAPVMNSTTITHD
jgi:hypothetical protein